VTIDHRAITFNMPRTDYEAAIANSDAARVALYAFISDCHLLHGRFTVFSKVSGICVFWPTSTSCSSTVAECEDHLLKIVNCNVPAEIESMCEVFRGMILRTWRLNPGFMHFFAAYNCHLREKRNMYALVGGTQVTARRLHSPWFTNKCRLISALFDYVSAWFYRLHHASLSKSTGPIVNEDLVVINNWRKNGKIEAANHDLPSCIDWTEDDIEAMIRDSPAIST
jgi:hypothetical protein